MSGQNPILARIRAALKMPAPRLYLHAEERRLPSSIRSGNGDCAAWLPAGGNTLDERVALFRKHSQELRTDFRLIEDFDSLTETLAALANEEGWRKIATHRGKLTTICNSVSCEILLTDGGYDANVLETCDAGVTECDALVAQTGSVLLTSRSAGGRALSALPPHHIVLARLDQLLPDLPSAMQLLQTRYGPEGYPSFISFITGPSRTGDIERILVLGAHGPKKLTILCLR